jgi:hypothetical protein
VVADRRHAAGKRPVDEQAQESSGARAGREELTGILGADSGRFTARSVESPRVLAISPREVQLTDVGGVNLDRWSGLAEHLHPTISTPSAERR